MKLSNVYLLLALLGGVVPFIFFLQFFAESGIDLTAFIVGVTANGAAAGFSADLIIASVTFWIAIWELHRSDNGPAPWAFIILNIFIGLSFALPLYIFLRHIQRKNQPA